MREMRPTRELFDFFSVGVFVEVAFAELEVVDGAAAAGAAFVAAALVLPSCLLSVPASDGYKPSHRS